MALSDILNKMSPVGNKITRDMSESEYMRLVDRNTELFDENKELHEEIERLNNIIKETKDYLEYQISQLDFYEDTKAKMLVSMAIILLKGSNKQ